MDSFLHRSKLWQKWIFPLFCTTACTLSSSFCHHGSHISWMNRWFLSFLLSFPVGTWDFPPLSKHTFPIGGHTSRPAGRHQHCWEAGEEQTASPLPRERREASAWAQSRQIRGVLRTHTGMRPISTSHLKWHHQIWKIRQLTFFSHGFILLLIPSPETART